MSRLYSVTTRPIATAKSMVLFRIIPVKNGMTYPQMSLRIGNLEGVKEFVNIQSDSQIVVSCQDVSFLRSGWVP